MTLKLSPGNFFGESLKSRQVAAFKLSERIYPPGFETPRHSHRCALFCLVIDGTYTETYGARTRACSPSTLLFHPPNELHAEHFHTAGGRSFIIEIEPEWLDRVRAQGPIADGPADFHGGVTGLLGRRLYHEFLAIDDASPLVVEGLMLEMLGEASRYSTQLSGARPPRWLERARELLRAEFARHLTLDEVAATAGVHPVHLAQVFHRHCGCTVGEYIRQLRVAYACHELVTSDTPLIEIALAAGFADQSHFTRTFKRYIGVPPSQYRASLGLS